MALGRTVEELAETTSAREILDWQAYWNVEPWGAIRDNMHAGIITSMIFNANRSRNDKARSYSDFMLKDPEQVKESGTQKFVAALRALAVPRKK